MNIEVGEYVRTRGIIGKLVRIEYDKIDTSLKWYVLDRGINMRADQICYVNKPYIEKHSKNIIDLIEVGDYVNGREVKHIAMFEGFPDYPKLIFVDERKLLPDETCENEYIKTILTHEMYEANCYRLEDK